VARSHPDRQRVSVTVPAAPLRRLGERLNFSRRQVLANTNLGILRTPNPLTRLRDFPQNRLRSYWHITAPH
jgi:hypothetical protein